MIVLGIDPSTRATGYALLRAFPRKYSMIELGVFVPPSNLHAAGILRFLHGQIQDLLLRIPPQVLSIESGFVGRNYETALCLGQVRGACMAAMGAHGEVIEIEPSIAKLCVTGQGDAGKDAVQRAVRNLFDMDKVPLPDAADAAAVAIAAAQEAFDRLRR